LSTEPNSDSDRFESSFTNWDSLKLRGERESIILFVKRASLLTSLEGTAWVERTKTEAVTMRADNKVIRFENMIIKTKTEKIGRRG